MTDAQPGELRELISHLSDGTLTLEQAERLNELLKKDPIAQDEYLDHMMVDGLLEREFGGSAIDQTAFGQGGLKENSQTQLSRPQMGRSTWRKQLAQWVAASAAVLFFGVFATWEFLVVRLSAHETIPLKITDGGFESRGFEWYGDSVEGIETFDGVVPAEGRQMLRFVKSSTDPANTCEIYQLVDLRDASGQIDDKDAYVEATASFNAYVEGLSEKDYLFGLTVYAFSEEPTTQFLATAVQDEQPLSFSGRQLSADDDKKSWQEVNTRMPLTPGTQFLIVRLSVKSLRPDEDGVFPGHFADNVAVNLLAYDRR